MDSKTVNILSVKLTYHMSICVEYSVDPKSTSGGLYLQAHKYVIC